MIEISEFLSASALAGSLVTFEKVSPKWVILGWGEEAFPGRDKKPLSQHVQELGKSICHHQGQLLCEVPPRG